MDGKAKDSPMATVLPHRPLSPQLPPPVARNDAALHRLLDSVDALSAVFDHLQPDTFVELAACCRLSWYTAKVVRQTLPLQAPSTPSQALEAILSDHWKAVSTPQIFLKSLQEAERFAALVDAGRLHVSQGPLSIFLSAQLIVSASKLDSFSWIRPEQTLMLCLGKFCSLRDNSDSSTVAEWRHVMEFMIACGKRFGTFVTLWMTPFCSENKISFPREMKEISSFDVGSFGFNQRRLEELAQALESRRLPLLDNVRYLSRDLPVKDLLLLQSMLTPECLAASVAPVVFRNQPPLRYNGVFDFLVDPPVHEGTILPSWPGGISIQVRSNLSHTNLLPVCWALLRKRRSGIRELCVDYSPSSFRLTVVRPNPLYEETVVDVPAGTGIGNASHASSSTAGSGKGKKHVPPCFCNLQMHIRTSSIQGRQRLDCSGIVSLSIFGFSGELTNVQDLVSLTVSHSQITMAEAPLMTSFSNTQSVVYIVSRSLTTDSVQLRRL